MDKINKAFKECENLVGKRFNFDTLKKELDKRFGIEGTLLSEGVPQCNPDFQLTYIIDDDYCFDIYYLKMRDTCPIDKANIYITEIGYEMY